MYIRLTFAVALCLIFLYQIEAKPALSDEILSDLINLEKALVKRKLSLVTRDGEDQPGQGNPNDPPEEQPEQAGNDKGGNAGGNHGNEQGGQGEQGARGPQSEFERKLAAMGAEYIRLNEGIKILSEEGYYDMAAQKLNSAMGLLDRYVEIVMKEIEKQLDKHRDMLHYSVDQEYNKLYDMCDKLKKDSDPEPVSCFGNEQAGQDHGEEESDGVGAGEGEGGSRPGPEGGEGEGGKGGQRPDGEGGEKGEKGAGGAGAGGPGAGESERKPGGEGEGGEGGEKGAGGAGPGDAGPGGAGGEEGAGEEAGAGAGAGAGEGAGGAGAGGAGAGGAGAGGAGAGGAGAGGAGAGGAGAGGAGAGEGAGGAGAGEGAGESPNESGDETRRLAQRLLNYVRSLASKQK